MNARTTLAAGAAIAMTLLTACTPQTSTTPPPATSSTTAPTQHVNDHDGITPTWTSAPDHDGAAVTAADALRAYSDRDLDYTAWFAQLEPYLHPTAVDAYSTVDPANIPAFTITGDAVTTSTSTDTYAVVYVPTSVGDYTVELRRDSTGASWGVTRLQPPTQ